MTQAVGSRAMAGLNIEFFLFPLSPGKMERVAREAKGRQVSQVNAVPVCLAAINHQ